MTIRLKRMYDEAAGDDGYRVLVDAMWPRGVAKRDAALDDWCKDLAPSKALRQWFGHDRERWGAFHNDYLSELAHADEDTLGRLLDYARSHSGLTLLFAAKDTECNNAAVLKEYLEKRA